MRAWFIGLLLLVFSVNVQAGYQAVVSEQVVEEVDERKARSQAIDQATDAVTLEFVKKEIGSERFLESQDKIESQVKPLKNRFIPFFKILSSKKVETGFQFSIELKISKKDLRYVLRQTGLFASSEKTGITLPFIEFNNSLTGESYRWWSTEFSVSNDLEAMASHFEKEMFQGLLSKGLFLLRPQMFKMGHLIPQFMKKAYLSQSDMVQLTHLKRGQLYLDGRVDVLTSPLREGALRVRVEVSCKQSSNGKSVAEVVRTYDTPSGQKMSQLGAKIKELAQETGVEIANQVYDLWQRGALEAQLLKLAVTGNLDHMQLVRFKRELRDKAGLSNELVERLYEPGRVTFETDYSGGVENLVQRLRQTQFDGFISQVVSSQADQITLEVRVAQ